MNICVVGTGYVGLVTGAVFADLGNDVVCVDKIGEKIETLKQGRMPIYEPGLEEMVARNVADGRLAFTTDLSEGVRKSEIVFIAVGTPPKSNGETDLSAVEEVARGIARAMERYKVIVNKSTVPVGTGNLVREIILTTQPRPVEFDVVSNPEFLREGSAIEDTLRPDRIVIGAPSQQVAMTLLELYAPLERPMIITDVPSAEMIKYASNAFLASKVSFINAIANICELASADVTQVTKGLGLDRRIGPAFLQAGLGFGGACLPKDIESLIHTAGSLGYDFKLLKAVAEINRERTQRFVEAMRKALGSLDDKVIAILGLAYTPNTDTLRRSSAVELCRKLLAAGAIVKAYDPAVKTLPPELSAVTLAANMADALKNADAAVVCTEWPQFREAAWPALLKSMRKTVIVEASRFLEKELKDQPGVEHLSVGRPS
jgi:UDPglucose 6-dehydrogenase